MKKKTTTNNDPYLDRESSRYKNPIPSREYVLQVMENAGVPLERTQLYQLLKLKKNECPLFDRRLAAMERDGEILRNRKNAFCVAQKLNLIRGRVVGHPDGFGFISPDEGGDDLYLSPKEMLHVLHGDHVMVRAAGVDRRGRTEAKIVEVLEHANHHLVGRLILEEGLVFVTPEDRRITQDILIPPGKAMRAKAGQVVVVELTTQPFSHAHPIGQVIEVLGDYANAGMEIEIALRKHRLPHQFDRAVMALTNKLPGKVRTADCTGRIDLRDLALITIDGETARDFDDAVYCEPCGKGWRLIVAIADVSFYVKPGDVLDQAAYERGNSVYFPRRVIPMLPEPLSNGLCSLNPEEDRLCMVCDMEIDLHGTIQNYRFYEAVMQSKARLTYDQAYSLIQNHQTNKKQAWLLPHIQHLYALYLVLLQARAKRGAIDFETVETLMQFDEHGKIAQIVPLVRNEAHRLIEECMLAANVSAAHFLSTKKQPVLYRVHAGPNADRLAALRSMLANFGLSLGGGDKPRAIDYSIVLDQIRKRVDAQLLQTLLLRSMQQAVYQADNIGHFGLAYDCYTHFTSPIRRYPDLLVHRAIKATLNAENTPPPNWQTLGAHCSATERRADEATRDVETWLKCYYMQDKIGKTFMGTVASVVSFGLFVLLDDIYVEGLVHVTDLGNDYFQFDAARYQMMGERTGKRYRIGDRLQIRVVRADMTSHKIDFVLTDKPNRHTSTNPAKNHKKKK